VSSRFADRFPAAATAVSVLRQLRRSGKAFAEAGRDERGPRELARQIQGGRLLELDRAGLVDLRIEAAPVVASQKLDELLPALERVQALSPRRVCEIGTSAGGTLYLLTRVSAPDALIVSIDLTIAPHTQSLRARLARPGQRLVSIAGDSHNEATASRLRELLGHELLDVLFIDGDHSYDGVRADFELYSPLVRSGGIVLLHDVNEDYRTSRGLETPSISGEVPRFWHELKGRHQTEELVAEPGQDGYGIGLVYV
jgi:predicted O-methyltransferase YrrM